MNRFNFRLDSIRRPFYIRYCIDSSRLCPLRLYRFKWALDFIPQAAPGVGKMESLILASYVLKSNQRTTEIHPAFDEAAQQSARSALSSIAASLVGMGAFAFVLSLLG